MRHPLPCECQKGYLSGMHASAPSRTRSGFLSVLELQAELSRRVVERQHLSGIHPPGGKVPSAEPVVQKLSRPGTINCYVTPSRTTEPTADVARASVAEITGPPPTETRQRWAAAVAHREVS